MDFISIVGIGLQMIGLFAAFISAAFGFVFAQVTKGGAFEKSGNWISAGLSLLAIAFFLSFVAGLTGNYSFNNILTDFVSIIAIAGFGAAGIGNYTFIKSLRGDTK